MILARLIDICLLLFQAFRAIHGREPSSLRRRDQLWKVMLAGERAQDAGGPYRESWTMMAQDLMSSTLPLLKPCPNAQADATDGLNRDTWVLNPIAQVMINSKCLNFSES